MRSVMLLLSILSMVFLGTASAASTHSVQLEDKQFIFEDKAVEKITIKKGDTVIFKNNDTIDYDIGSHSKAKTFKLGVLKPGATKSVIFNTSGIVEVECAIHSEMFLELQVE